MSYKKHAFTDNTSSAGERAEDFPNEFHCGLIDLDHPPKFEGGVPPKGRIVLVQDNDKKPPHYWKMPGGRRQEGDHSPSEVTGVREVEEEIGPRLSLREGVEAPFWKEHISGSARRPHDFIAWVMDGSGLDPAHLREGVEIEKIRIHTVDEVDVIIRDQLALPRHSSVLFKYLQEFYGRYRK